MKRRGTVISLLVAAALASPASAADLAIIVHAKRDTQLTVEQVAQIYLKGRRFWADGARIVPVNRDSGSEARRFFDRQIFGADARRLVVYWNRQYFRGVLPPATLASDEAVKRFVADEPLAIGYVHSSVIDASVRVLLHITGSSKANPVPVESRP